MVYLLAMTADLVNLMRIYRKRDEAKPDLLLAIDASE